MYNDNNVFAKILRGEIPADKIYENEYALSIRDVNPAADVHALVLPKGEYKNIHDFMSNADEKAVRGFWHAFRETLNILGISDDYNVLANTGAGPFSSQTVMHFHMHILCGKRLKDIE